MYIHDIVYITHHPSSQGWASEILLFLCVCVCVCVCVYGYVCVACMWGGTTFLSPLSVVTWLVPMYMCTCDVDVEHAVTEA